MPRHALALAVTILVTACSAAEITAIKGAMVPEAGWYTFRATTKNRVVLSGAMLLSYTGTDSLSGDVIAADPVGKPYLEGHFVTARSRDGSYVFEIPRSELEPTGSKYVTRLYRTRDGYTCEFSEMLYGKTATSSCEVATIER